MKYKVLLRKYAWAIALVVVIFAGYQVGKDRALRDNARDAELSRGVGQ